MDQSFVMNVPFVNSVFHPSDFSPASENAFAHALAIALVRKTAFTILHVGGSRADWKKFPAVRATLERWGLLEEGSRKSAVFDQLSLRVKKVMLKDRHPVKATLEYLKKHPTDLIVLATEGREGLPRWLRHSVAEGIASRSDTKTLFVPAGAKGFVSVRDGTISIRRILVPVDREPSPLPSIEYAIRMAEAMSEPVEIFLLHIGGPESMPALELPERASCRWKTEQLEGDVVDLIAGKAEELDADLIIMTTAGREGILDALRGSVTQQVLRRTPCPLLAVPVNG